MAILARNLIPLMKKLQMKNLLMIPIGVKLEMPIGLKDFYGYASYYGNSERRLDSAVVRIQDMLKQEGADNYQQSSRISEVFL